MDFFFTLKISWLITNMRGLLPALFLNDFLHDGKPRVLGGLKHLELLLGQLVHGAFHAMAFKRAREA